MPGDTVRVSLPDRFSGSDYLRDMYAAVEERAREVHVSFGDRRFENPGRVPLIGELVKALSAPWAHDQQAIAETLFALGERNPPGERFLREAFLKYGQDALQALQSISSGGASYPLQRFNPQKFTLKDLVLGGIVKPKDVPAADWTWEYLCDRFGLNADMTIGELYRASKENKFRLNGNFETLLSYYPPDLCLVGIVIDIGFIRNEPINMTAPQKGQGWPVHLVNFDGSVLEGLQMKELVSEYARIGLVNQLFAQDVGRVLEMAKNHRIVFKTQKDGVHQPKRVVATAGGSEMFHQVLTNLFWGGAQVYIPDVSEEISKVSAALIYKKVEVGHGYSGAPGRLGFSTIHAGDLFIGRTDIFDLGGVFQSASKFLSGWAPGLLLNTVYIGQNGLDYMTEIAQYTLAERLADAGLIDGVHTMLSPTYAGRRVEGPKGMRNVNHAVYVQGKTYNEAQLTKIHAAHVLAMRNGLKVSAGTAMIGETRGLMSNPVIRSVVPMAGHVGVATAELPAIAGSYSTFDMISAMAGREADTPHDKAREAISRVYDGGIGALANKDGSPKRVQNVLKPLLLGRKLKLKGDKRLIKLTAQGLGVARGPFVHR